MREQGTGNREQAARRGSALLIVLGMLAFSVASAVAFSAYMRYARMPSSFLRRTSSSRLLVKAALAEAIDIIDISIGNDRCPGQKGRQADVRNYKRITEDEEDQPDVIDYWQDRCYIGSNRLVSVKDTVATLCTEALAYIPPPLINEVRYYSRRSVAAAWHTLGYDSGRYAFTAVDVSDFFDVNSVRANPSDISGQAVLYGRNSSDCGRITLAHAFENPAHTGYAFDPDRWDDFMDAYLDDGEPPLVSVADLNLAMNAPKQGSRMPAHMSPFCNYILNRVNFVTSRSSPEAKLVRSMKFVTDGIFTMTNRTSGLNLARASDQPFYGVGRLDGDQISVNALLSGGGNNFTRYMESPRSKFNNDPEYVQLLDYLDENSVPATLALPTVERTPMITGVGLDGEVQLTVEKGDPISKDVTEGGQQFRYYTTSWTLKLNGELKVDAGTVYPFKYERDGEGKSYKMQAAATIALVPADSDPLQFLRNKNAREETRVTLFGGKDWSGVETAWPAKLGDNRAAAIRCVSKEANVPFEKNPRTEEAAIAPNDVGVAFPSFGGLAFATELPETARSPKMTCTFRTVTRKVKIKDGEEVEVPFTDTTPAADRVGALPLLGDLSGLTAANDVLGRKYIPTIQVWVRIFDDEGYTVDLVPACWRDDRGPYDGMQDDMRGSSQYPFVRFRMGAEVHFDTESGELKGSVPGAGVEISPQGYLADDPRFNYAPENLIVLPSKSGEFKQIWFAQQRSASRDGDIFMATSDAGYLQSVYELTHLVATSRYGGDCGVADGTGYDGKARDKFEGCPANRAMWCTYTQYPSPDSGSGEEAKNDIDGLDVINGTRGFRVNPYTQSTDIMLAALANTPLNWWAASTNDAVNEAVHDSAANAAKYSFSEMSGAQVKLRHDDLEAIAENMIGRFRGSTADWRQEFDAREWWRFGAADTLCGVQLTGNDVKLHSVDRKFLHGFWKECLANRQQLFLVFVRAEPMMMGGGFEQSPPQLGARAVALVWRDPTQTGSNVPGPSGFGTGPRPHRTRILFYRQFD